MPKLDQYDKSLEYSYALGIFPATECLTNARERCLRLLVSSDSQQSEGVRKLMKDAQDSGIRCETADRVLERISKKGNCHAAMVYRKAESELSPDTDHLLLHHPSDSGNMGTIMRTALGFGCRDLAIVRPAVDSDDPHVVRASMGAVFSLRIHHYESYEDYRSEFKTHEQFPFMLTGSVPVEEAVRMRKGKCTLIFGNEATGLPDEFASYGTGVRIPHSNRIDSLNLAMAAGIGMYLFSESDEKRLIK